MVEYQRYRCSFLDNLFCQPSKVKFVFRLRLLLFELQTVNLAQPWPLKKRMTPRVPAFQSNSDLFDRLKWIVVQ